MFFFGLFNHNCFRFKCHLNLEIKLLFSCIGIAVGAWIHGVFVHRLKHGLSITEDVDNFFFFLVNHPLATVAAGRPLFRCLPLQSSAVYHPCADISGPKSTIIASFIATASADVRLMKHSTSVFVGSANCVFRNIAKGQWCNLNVSHKCMASKHTTTWSVCEHLKDEVEQIHH